MDNLLDYEVKPKPTVPANITNAELLLHIDNEYPNLQGPLKIMAERFRMLLEHTTESLPKHIDCPSCGNDMQIRWSVRP